jgi:hypothetical protein
MQQTGAGGPGAPVEAEGSETIATWPKTVEARPDTFTGEALLGPWG